MTFPSNDGYQGTAGFVVSMEDRIELASMLIKFGYSVRIVKEKDRNGKSQIIVRYEEQEQPRQ